MDRKKKWLIIQSDLEYGPYGTDNSQFLRECYSIKYALEQNGYEADIWGYRHSNFNNKPNFNDYDYLFMEEQYEFDWIPWNEIGNSSAVKLQLMGDIHVHKSYLQWTHLFDIICHPIKSMIPDFQKQFPTKKHIWYPSAMDGRYYYKRDLMKIYNIIWMGSKTRKYVKQLMDDVGLIQMLRAGQAYIDTLARTKVALNTRSANDLNYKNHEIVGVGTCLVTNYDPAFEEMGYKNNVNCLFYKNYNECVDMINYALSDDNWIRLGEEGYKISRDQTYESRFTRVKKILNGELEGVDYA